MAGAGRSTKNWPGCQNKNFIDGESKNEVEKLKDHIKSMVQGCASFRFLCSYKDATGN